MTNDMKKDVEKRKGKASLDCGTRGGWLWLLRSRPDQIHHSAMRRGPPSGIVQQSRICAKRNHYFSDYSPSFSQIISTFFCTSSDIRIIFPHVLHVSPAHLSVASIPILLPRPLTGDAKSR